MGAGTFQCHPPRETMELVSRAGVSKAHMRPDKAFMSSVMAGMLLSFACATLLTMNSSPWYQENAPGFIRVVAALVFPYGLTMIVLSGTDLCTGSFMYTTVSVLHGRLSVVRMLLHWVITFFGNLAGSLFLVTIIAGYGGILSSSPYDAEVQSFAHTKQVVPQWHMIFLRGIGANWLVCMACFLGLSGRDYVSKLVGIWWPTFAFVSLGFDHVVANMFFIPIAIFQGSPDITVGLYIWKGMIPAGLGNIVGGGLFVGVFYWYLHLTGLPNAVDVDGTIFEGSSVHVLEGLRKSRGSSETRIEDEERGVAGEHKYGS